jgi:ubiquinone/menaquinone biosynthesis C-methylase UbiE
LHRAQLEYVSKIPSHANVLILGGGTGKILKDVCRQSSSLQIYYVEASSEMIERARKNVDQSKNQVHFIHGTEHSIPKTIHFDVVITNFFLDMFSDAGVSQLIAVVSRAVKKESTWMVTDFVRPKKSLYRLLLRIMYLFFRTFCKIEARQLPLWENELKKAGLQEKKNELFYGGFIKSVLYRWSKK